jgi:hypothetical protein
MKIRPIVISIASLFVVAQAQASNTTFSTGFSAAGAQNSAQDYLTTVSDAVANNATSGYGTASISLYDNISNHGVFGGSKSNIAFESIIKFGVATAGSYDFRFGVDFGNGGAVFLDGTALSFNRSDMWWSDSYTNPSQSFQYTLNLTSGNHTFAIYGLDGCCDGGQQAQFKSSQASDFVTFGANDGMNVAAVPEPETYAMLMAGLGLIGVVVRRRGTRSAA